MTSFKERFKQQEKERQAKAICFERPDYTFHDTFHKQISCDTSNDNIGRVYHVDDSSKFHSVTTVLSATKSEEDKRALENWKKRVGELEAERIKNAAADRGSIMHDMCEAFILGNGKFVPPEYGTNAYALFRQIYPLLLRINNIHNLEGVLYSKKLKLAGRVDCVGEFDGVLSIIDFKTATKIRDEWMLKDYFTQETCYAIMFAEMYGIPVKQIVTLMAIDNDVSAKQGIVTIKKPIDYVETVVQRVEKFQQMV